MKYKPMKSQIGKNLRIKTLTYKNQILLKKTKNRDIKNEYILYTETYEHSMYLSIEISYIR